MSADEVGEITDLRVLVEGDLLARAVPAMTTDDLERVAAAAGAAERAAPTPGWVAADRAFHAALYAPAGRPRWLALALSLRGEVERYEAAHARLPKRREEWLHDHVRLVAACRERDAAAARRVLEDHVARAGAFLATCLAGAGP